MSTGRKPLTVVELEQPRCALRFGVGDCTATGTKCYNTQGTCGDLLNYDGTGSIKWRFVDGRPGVYDFADLSDADNPELNPLPCLVSVSTSEGEINAGSNLDGRAALGVTSKVTVTLQDFPWNDAAGDYYLSDRSGVVAGKPAPVRADFWALWTARNTMFAGVYLRVYDGYEGQALGDMRQRLYVLDKVNGPDANGKVTLTGLDPLRLAGNKKAEFPKTSDLELFGSLTAASTAIFIFGDEADLSADYGNTGSTRYLAIGKEIISYTGYTDQGDGRYRLDGATRGALNTEAKTHSDQAKVQRVGRYEDEKFWRVLNDLFVNHTEIPSDFIPLTDWDAEGNKYLPTYRATHTVVKPTPVEELAGQIAQQGLFFIWWSEYDQEIKMLAVRPPEGEPEVFTDSANIMDGATLTRDPSIRVSQVAVFYDQIDVFDDGDDDFNYRRRFVAVDGQNLGETRAKSIYAPWIASRTQAVQLATRLLIRYRTVPQFLKFSIDAKDRDVARIGDLLDIETRSIVTSEGGVQSRRWQVISAKEMVAGHSYVLNCQTFDFIGRFAYYMADGSPTYDAATTEQRKSGGWYAADTGLMSDGSEGYKYQ